MCRFQFSTPCVLLNLDRGFLSMVALHKYLRKHNKQDGRMKPCSASPKLVRALNDITSLLPCVETCAGIQQCVFPSRGWQCEDGQEEGALKLRAQFAQAKRIARLGKSAAKAPCHALPTRIKQHLTGACCS